MVNAPPPTGSETAPAPSPRLILSLADATRTGPAERKLLVVPRRGLGKEFLRALARSGTSWLGWEVLTLRPLALEIASGRLAAADRDVLDEFAEQARVDEALDEVLAGPLGAPFEALAEGVGFRRAVRGAVQALRLAGIGADRTVGASGDRDKRALLSAVLRGYAERLDAVGPSGRRSADTAFVLREAVDALEAGDPTGYDRIWLLPGLGRRGLAGRLVDRLRERGAEVLAGDPVVGLEPPGSTLWSSAEGASPLSWVHAVEEVPRPAPDAVEIDLFHAASVADELKEVLRRVLARGLAWDEVEIVATDAGVYGPALHALAGRLDVPVTFGVGLPVERTRVGHAVEQYFRWIRDDFPSPVIRRLLETHTLRPPRPHHRTSGGALARRLRGLRVGWGRGRYLAALDAAVGRGTDARPGRKETAEDAKERVARERRYLEALRAILGPVLEAIPAVPARLDTDPPRVSPAELAAGLEAFLDFVPGGSEVERTALERVGRILGRVRAELRRPTEFESAVTILRDHLSIRVPAPRAEGPAPWRSTGGHLYLSDLENGGASGRRHTFVVGLDAGRTSAGAFQDPLLLDAERTALAPSALPTSADRLEDFRFRLAALFGGLRGSVTFSYAAWDPAEARGLLPSPLLLQLHRLDSGDTGAGYEELRRRLGDPVAAVPRSPRARAIPVDAADVWLAALATDEGLLRGDERVREAYADLARGLAARDALDGPPSPHHGLVEARPGLDPRRSGEPVSASRLETLGACPRRYFMRYVLDVKPPRDPTLDPDRWLDALERGSLLHAVYERALREARERGVDFDDDAFPELALATLDEEARIRVGTIPPPSSVVLQRELEQLQADVRAFVSMVRSEGDRWIEVELSFGMPRDPREPVPMDLPGGEIRVRGAVDRVDEVAGGLRLVDYKTGSKPKRYEEGGTFHGGRRLQHLLYSRAAEVLFDRPVHGLSYHLPTRDAENAVVRYQRSQLAGGMGLVAELLDGVAAGRFVPTEDVADCKWCEYRPICRVSGEYRNVESPLAAWSAARLEDEEALEHLRRVRGWPT